MKQYAPEDIPKAYLSADVEKKWSKQWLDSKAFHAPDKSVSKETFSMVIPPPNITGVLHMGHALNNTLQDILARYHRMQGKDTLWMPGTDHAGIATQNVVEKAMMKEGVHRDELGREGFVDRVWKWRDECGGAIVEQLKRMGCSCDWDRIRFTMDEGLSKAVKQVFVSLYDKGLIYKSYYIINWCPRCQTALSDEEASHRDLDGALYHIQYSIEGMDEKVVIATTRPETLLGDTAIGFNPDDERYQQFIGKTAVLPILGRKLKIIQDSEIDPSFGTGALKITPAHDPVDFNLGKKHDLEFVNIMNPDGTLNENAGPYAGQDRFVARKALVADLKAQGFLLKVEPHQHAVGHCYRCDTIVEPYCSDQWFVKMKPLAEPAIEAVTSGEVKFHPERWTKTYMEWMTGIRDWCISRQIWWGHRIPVYYDEQGNHTAAMDEADARKRLKLGPDAKITQDPDVLDTWFSSWLWPFSTLGWPDQTESLKSYYPTKALVTGYEIIFFWVARMMMASCEFMKKPPFKDIYIHGIVRDQQGAKMSKSKGNVIDPVEIIDEFGADALRYSIISITSEGQDVLASKERCEIGRNFANKIWNASRFVMMNLKTKDRLEDIDVKDLRQTDLWILSRLEQTVKSVTTSIEEYHFNEASTALYEFFWGDFCDWYLELSKPFAEKASTQAVLRHCLETSLRLLHPFMPFITEEIWEWLHEGKAPSMLMLESWPIAEKRWTNPTIEADMKTVIEQIQSIRNARAVWNVPPKEQVHVVAMAHSEKEVRVLETYEQDFKRMARIKELKYGLEEKRPEQSVAASVGKIASFVRLEGLVDLKQETGRLQKDLDQVAKWIKQTHGKLSNKEFTSKAPKQVVQKETDKLAGLEDQKKRLEENLKSLA